MNCYIHVPFCRSKCGYCAFYSLPGAGQELIDAYLAHLEKCFAPQGRAETLYIGGGTPTLLSVPQLERLFRLIRKRLDLAPGAEISCESNPETLDEEKIALLRTFVTRLSTGVQSFDPSDRRKIGRCCSQNALLSALGGIKKAAFPHWNIDLIFALPGQSDESFFKGAELALDCGIDHLSCYALTAEEQAALKLPEDDDRAAELLPQIGAFLHERGLERYEISNYARPGCECRHNQSVWRGGLLHGFGPAAASFDGSLRSTECDSLEKWLKDVPPVPDPLPRGKRLNEIFAVNLRTTAGWTPELWAQVPFADSWENRLAVIRRCREQFSAEWFYVDDGHIALSGEGLMFWNSVAGEILCYGT